MNWFMGERHGPFRPLMALAFWCLATCGAASADPGALMGGGNFTNGEVNPGVLAQFRALNAAGAKMCRVNVYPSVYLVSDDWSRPNPRVLDAVMAEAHRHGITPVILFEYYAGYYKDTGFGTRAQWQALGRAFAERYRPGGAFGSTAR